MNPSGLIERMMSDGTATLEGLAQLNALLRKAADVGYQTAPGMGSGQLAPLVAQSIEPLLSSATFDMQELVLWSKIPKTSASQTLHEYAVEQSHGLDLDPFVSEGSAGANNRSTYTRGSVQIKYLLERREITDVASMVGLLGPSADALAEQTQQGMLSLLSKVEKAMWHAQSALNPLAFTGIIPQIEANTNPDGTTNVTDLAGGAISMDYLEEVLGELGSAPRFGYPDTIYVEPRVFRDLSRQSNPAGRLSLDQAGRSLTYGVRELAVQGPHGPVPIVQAPFLYRNDAAPTAASSTDNAPATPALDQQPTDNGAGTSSWTTAEAGTYIYKIVAVGAKGYSAPLTTNPIAAVAGSKIKIIVNNSNTGVLYYRVYRSAKNGAAGTAKLLFEVAAVAGVATTITDLSAIKANCSHVVLVQHDPKIFCFARLLDLIRRPLAEVETTKPFALMMFGSPIVKVPSKCWVFKNVGSSAPVV